jgi:hypothetical protein
MLRGGWIMVAILSFNFLMALGDAIVSWRISGRLAFWASLLCISVLGIGGAGAWRAGRQWLLIPGGLVLRKARWRGGWDLQRFRRCDGVLMLGPYWRKLWWFCVADGGRHGSAQVTPEEARLLLRAWLSPLEAPSVEAMSDLG